MADVQNQSTQTDPGAGAATQAQQTQVQQTQPPSFDYDKLASLIQGKQTVAEDTVLKNYFKQQGMSEEEMKQAITSYKQQKAAQQPDVNAMLAQLTQAQTAAQQAQASVLQAQLESVATLEAVALGIDAKTIPYILKIADLSGAVGQDGKINNEAVKTALNKVLEDIPALKPAQAGATGFVQVGAASGSSQQNTTTQNVGNNNQTVPTKRWNRWNN